MEGNRHFSHDHPLILRKEVDDHDDQKAYSCRICGLPMLSSPSYTCSINGCKFFMHEPCAKLPEELYDPMHHDLVEYPHYLYLKQKSPPADSESLSKLCQNFTYQCSTCKTDVHPLLAKPVEIKSKHESHPSHPLVVNCRETFSLCDACGEKQKGFFFFCQECSFWIHQDCTVLPSILKLGSNHHPHPFILTYSLTSHIRRLHDQPECIICKKSVRLFNIGLYVCCQCTSYAHVSCAKSKMENLKSETELGFTELPDKGDTFPSLAIREFLQSNLDPDEKSLTIKKHHKHLEFHEHGFSCSNGEAGNLVCDVCVQPINSSSPCYSCLDSDCHFLAHNTCANLPPTSSFSYGKGLTVKLSLFTEASGYFFGSIYPCYICHRPWNGFCYYYVGFADSRMFFDLDCITALNTIKHASHKHALFRTSRWWRKDPLKCCSDRSDFFDVYRCILCRDFYIHVKCSLLPKTTRHILDKHPLELITSSREHHNCSFCEFCEKAIKHKYWYYGCRECEQYFHINCIPSVGRLSKVKFGKALADSNVHPHPLTLTRDHGSNEKCQSCKKTIGGSMDEMTFHCSDCDFWIHFSCARDKTSSRLPLYSEKEFFN